MAYSDDDSGNSINAAQKILDEVAKVIMGNPGKNAPEDFTSQAK